MKQKEEDLQHEDLMSDSNCFDTNFVLKDLKF